MSWIMRSATEAVDLNKDKGVLLAVAVLADSLAKNPRGIAGTNDLLSLLTRLSQADQGVRDEVIDILGRAAFDLVPEETAANLGATVTAMQGHLQKLGLLTCRWDQLGTAACADKPPVLHWSSVDRFSSPVGPGTDQIALNVSGLFDRGLAFDANPTIPTEMETSGTPAVRLGLRGKVESKSSAKIPIRLGSIGLSAESHGATHIDWFVARGGHRFVAGSFAATIDALANPFDLDALSMAFQDEGLLGVSVDAGGGFGLGGSLSIGITDQLFGQGGAKIELGFHSSRRGEFRLSVRPAGRESADPRAVRVDIRRTRVSEDVTSAAVGLTFDLSPTLKKLRPTLIKEAEEAGALLTELQDFFPPSEKIRGELTRQIESRVAAPELRAVLGTALGSSKDATDLDRLRQRLETAIDAQTDIWRTNLSTVAENAARDAIDGLPLPEDDRVLFRSISKIVAEQALSALHEDLDRELDRRIADSEAFGRLESALKEAGGKVDSGLARTDALSDPVKKQLDRFQHVLAAITEAIQHSGEVKLDARWRTEERRSQGRTIDQSLLFRPDHPKAGDLYTRALTGSFEDLFESIAGKTAEETEKGPVTLIGGTLQEFANVRKQSGFELTLLDFKLGGQSLFDADVVIETDASGNIRVCTKATSSWSRWRPGESSNFEAVNVFELATAQETRRMNLSLSLSQVHKELREGEIREFFSGLADKRIALLAHGDMQSALEKLRRAAPDAGVRRSGEIRAWIELDEATLLRLLRISKPGAGPAANALTDHGKREIYEIAIDAMVAGLRTTGSSTDYRNLKRYLETNGHRDDLATVLKDMRLKNKRHKYAPHPSDDSIMVSGQPQYDRLEGIAKRAEGLVGTILAMREIYFSKPGASGWSIRDYQERQKTINDQIVYWVRGQPVDRGWFAVLTGNDSIGPYMLAFFKAIADLSRSPVAASAAPPLLASIVVPHAGRENEIMLVTDRAQPVPAPASPPPGPTPTIPTPPTPTSPPTTLPEQSPQPETRIDNDDQRSKAMPKFTFPLEKKIRTYHSGGRRYGSRRSGGKRLHGGCDLTVAKNTRILAMADGVVVKGPYYFYEGTYALEVAHDVVDKKGEKGKILVRYGEINQRVPKGVKPGAEVGRGDLIATVGRLNSGASMLHLEMYSEGSSRKKLTVVGINKYKRRSDIKDPTLELDEAPTWASVRDKADKPGDTPKPEPKQEAKSREGTVDGSRITSPLNVRAEAKIVPGATTKFRLEPDDKVKVIRSVHGGPYPFGQGDLWFEIEHGSQTGFVVAYFIKTGYPIAGSKGLDKDAEPGYISRLDSGLNIRTKPSTEAEVLYKLEKGTAVAVLSQHTGGVYNSNRNDWLLIQPEGKKEGYAAAYYIDIGDPNAKHDTNPDDLENKNEWERVLLATEWAGASDQTARGQLGSGTPGGVSASERMAEQDLERVKEVAGVLADVAGKFGVPTALLAGIASRESRCGNALDNGWGDRGNGFGIMQVDKNAHSIRNTSDPYGKDHVEQATGIFTANLEALIKAKLNPQSPKADWEDQYILLGATAAYNFGLGNVRTKTKIDEGTTGDDYGSDVLARAKYYYRHEDLHLLRS